MVAAAARAVQQRLGGGRGYALLGAGAGWIAYGISIIQEHRPAVSRGTIVLTSWWPLTWWGVVWIVCGALAAVCSLRRPGADVLGWFVAAVPPLVWSAAYLIATTTGRYPSAWTGVPAWLVPVELLATAALLSRQLESRTAELAALQQELAVARQRIAETEGGTRG